MKLFKRKKTENKKSLKNKEKMRTLFNQAVEGGSNYQLIYAYCMEVFKKDKKQESLPFTYKSIIIGYSYDLMSLILLETTKKLDRYKKMICFEAWEFQKALYNKALDTFTLTKQSGKNKEKYEFIIVYDNDDEEFLASMEQKSETREFKKFFKKFKKNKKKKEKVSKK